MQRLKHFLTLAHQQAARLMLAALAISGLLFSPALANGAATGASSSVTLTGTLLIVWGDSAPGEKAAPSTTYSLVDDTGQRYGLEFDPRLNDRLDRLYTKRVTVTGSLKSARNLNGQNLPVVSVEGLQSLGQGQTAFQPTVTGNHRFLSIMCKFSDLATTEPRDQNWFLAQLGNARPGFNNYIQEMSFGTANLDNSQAVGWVTLPQTRTHYVNSSNELTELAHDCATASNQLNLSSYYGLNFMFNGVLGCCAWGGSDYLSNANGQSGVWYMTWMPYYGESQTFGWREHGVLAHEMSHAFGSPHSGSSIGYEYGSSWDVVSNPQAHCTGTVIDPTYGCVGQGSVTYNRDRMGFIPAGRKATFDASQGPQTYTLDNLSQLTPTGNASRYMIVVPSIANPSTRYYTIEARKQQSYDVKLPLAHAIIIHDVDTTRYVGGNPPVAYLYPPPGAAHDALRGPGGDPGTGDAAANWPVGQTLTDTTNKVTITVVADLTTGFTVKVAPIDTSAIVKVGTDDSTGATDTLSAALNLANSDSSINVITFQLPGAANNTVFVTGTLPAVRGGLRIQGKDCSDTVSPRITLNGGGSAARLNLSAGGITLSGLVIKGFVGPQVLKPFVSGHKSVTIQCSAVQK